MAETHLPAVIDTAEPYAPAPPARDADATRREWGQHPINIRMSLPLLFGRYYVTVVAGKERRRAARLEAERQKHRLDTGANTTVIFLAGLTTGLALLGAITLILVYGFGWRLLAVT
jgi:hypothetical protein